MGHSEDSIEDPTPTRRSRTPRYGRIDRSGDGDHATDQPISKSDATVSDIIAEFSEVFAFVRTRWARYAEEADPDLRGAGMMVLQMIERKGPMTATGLSQLLDMDKAVVSRQITKLRKLGFIETVPAPDDGRVTLLVVSDAAQEMLNNILQRWAHTYHERFEDWSEQDLEVLRAGLHRFNDSAVNLRTDGPAVRCARAAEVKAEGADPEPEADSTPPSENRTSG